jgi:hypothetical protein
MAIKRRGQQNLGSKPYVSILLEKDSAAVRNEAIDAIIPNHYGGEDNPREVIKVLREHLTRDEFIGALKFNIVKYCLRSRKKKGARDLRCMNYYSNYLIKFLNEETPLNDIA